MKNNTIQKRFTPQQALPKLKQYCAYQERCHQEVKEKLSGYAISGTDSDEIISRLIEENFLNEERFAIQFAGGKFRIKQWGKEKIKYELRQKQISDYCIKKALRSIEAGEYKKLLYRLAEEKLKTLKAEKNSFIKKRKLQDHLIAKGFETDLVYSIVKEI